MTLEQRKQLIGQLAGYLRTATKMGAFEPSEVVDWYQIALTLQNEKPCDCGKKTEGEPVSPAEPETE